MGFKSKVYIMTTEENYLRFRNRYENQNFEWYPKIKKLFVDISIYHETNTVKLSTEWRKWYPYYPYVQFVEKFFMSLDESEYKLVYIHEDNSTEEHGDYEEIYMYPVVDLYVDTCDDEDFEYEYDERVYIYDNNDKFILDALE